MTNISKDIILNTVSAAAPAPKNALVHGVYASEIILPWESAEEFELLHAGLTLDWSPQGRTEEETLLSLVWWHWLKHRSMRSIQMACRYDPMVAELKKAGAKSWPEVDSFLQTKAEAGKSAQTNAMAALEKMIAELDKTKALTGAPNPKAPEIVKQLAILMESLEKHVIPAFGQTLDLIHNKDYVRPNQPPKRLNVVEEAYQPDIMEKVLRIQAAIDGRIDKTLQRLVSIKEYKRLLQAEAPKKVSSPPLTPAQSEK